MSKSQNRQDPKSLSNGHMGYTKHLPDTDSSGYAAEIEAASLAKHTGTFSEFE